MADPSQLFVIEYYSGYADDFLVGGVAYGMEAAWRVADKVRDKYYPADIYQTMEKHEEVEYPGYYAGIHRKTPYVWIRQVDEYFFCDFEDMP